MCLRQQLWLVDPGIVCRYNKSLKLSNRVYSIITKQIIISTGKDYLKNDKMVYTLVVHFRAKDDDSVAKIKDKLVEASQVYSNDKETISWFVMQSVHNPRDFTIVERYVNEHSQKYHLENPYWKTFDPFVKPLLEGEMDLRRYEELDTSKEVKVESNETHKITERYQEESKNMLSRIGSHGGGDV